MTTVKNKHASATGIGVATHDDQVVYLSAVGHRTSLKSIWGSLVTRNDGKLSGFGLYRLKRLTHTKYAQFWTPILESTSTHMIVVAELATIPDKDSTEDLSENGCYILAFDPEGARHMKPRWGACPERQVLQKRATPKLQRHLVDRLNKMLSIPVLPQWSSYLWERGRNGGRWDDKGLLALTTNGDCVAGYWVNPGWRWTETIQEGLRDGRIRFPRARPVERIAALPKVA